MTDTKVALVTGASRGIGRAIATTLAADGYDIAGTFNRDEEAAASLVAEIEATGRRAIAYRADLSKPDDVPALSEAVVADFGQLDALVHNAGIASRGLRVADTEVRELNRVLGVHTVGPFQLSAALLPTIRKSPRAAIVMISSVITRNPAPGGGPYFIAKRAIEALAELLALEEAGNGVRVNVVAAGLTVTDMGDRLAHAVAGVAGAADLDASTPFGRVSRPSDIADAVAFLLSPAARQITGQRIAVDGGMGSIRDSSH
jgi:3-oxoacyl-[acyl-carrier protein] reductase